MHVLRGHRAVARPILVPLQGEEAFGAIEEVELQAVARVCLLHPFHAPLVHLPAPLLSVQTPHHTPPSPLSLTTIRQTHLTSF